ncbi:MAG: hypothetical protein Q9217_004092 [Psora testacea]
MIRDWSFAAVGDLHLGVSFAGNVYVLGGQIKEMKDELKDIKGDIKRIMARQTELERQWMSLAEKILMNCRNKE